MNAVSANFTDEQWAIVYAAMDHIRENMTAAGVPRALTMTALGMLFCDMVAEASPTPAVAKEGVEAMFASIMNTVESRWESFHHQGGEGASLQ
jgi:hypothetical protein